MLSSYNLCVIIIITHLISIRNKRESELFMNWIILNIRKIAHHKNPFHFTIHLLKSKLIFILGKNIKTVLPLSLFKYRRQNYYLHYAPNQFSQVLYTYPDIIRDPDDEEFLKAYLKPGDSYLDIGANIGTTTLCAATTISKNSHIKTGMVIAYEAHPQTFIYLTRSILNNPKIIPCIITRNIALGDKEGVLGFSNIKNHDDINHVLPNTTNNLNKNYLEVPVKRLDDELTFSKIDLIKIDVEGYELQVFNGAKSTLSKTSAIFFEIYDKNTEIFGYKTTEIINLLENIGFIIYKIDIVKNTLLKIDSEQYLGSPQCENMIAVRNEAEILSRTGYSLLHTI